MSNFRLTELRWKLDAAREQEARAKERAERLRAEAAAAEDGRIAASKYRLACERAIEECKRG